MKKSPCQRGFFHLTLLHASRCPPILPPMRQSTVADAPAFKDVFSKLPMRQSTGIKGIKANELAF